MVGLWSTVRSSASHPFLPTRPSTPRLSPTQAVVRVLPWGEQRGRGGGWMRGGEGQHNTQVSAYNCW
jgi:hypothetical protein